MTKTTILTALRFALSLGVTSPVHAWSGPAGVASQPTAIAHVHKAHPHLRNTEHTFRRPSDDAHSRSQGRSVRIDACRMRNAGLFASRSMNGADGEIAITPHFPVRGRCADVLQLVPPTLTSV
jgi:hypothetical protein